MGFIGLVTWSRVRGLWKKRSERLKECLRALLSRNLKSLACTFVHFNSWVGLYSFCLMNYCTFCVFLVKSRYILSLFFLHSPLADFFFFFFSFFCPTSCMCSLHCFSHWYSDGSYLGFLFCFCCFFCVVFRKQICFGSEGVAKDELVFRMLKHGHVSFQILT